MRSAATFSQATLAIVLLLSSAPAHAYLDPGTGSMLLQGILAGIAAAGAFMSLNYYRLKAFALRLMRKKDDAASK